MYKQQTVFILLLTIFLSACTNTQAKEIQNTPQQKLELAFVEDISISKVSQEQIVLIAQGQLPDSCSKVEKSDIEEIEGSFIVSIFSSRTPGSDCTPGPIPFEREIAIDLKNLEKTQVTIVVNGMDTTVQIPENLNLDVESVSTASPTPEPQVAVSVKTESNEQDNSQDQAEETQPVPTATETEQPTVVPAVVTEQSSVVSQTPTSEAIQPTSTPTQSSAQTEACIDKAAFYADITVPDNTMFKPGDQFEKVWRIRNEGTCTWNEGYALVYASGEMMSGSLSNPIPDVAPGEIAEISINFQAPSRWGQYTGNWQFQNDSGMRFGVGAGGHDYIWVQIFVDSPAQAPTSNPPPAIPPESPSDQAGQSPVQSQPGCADQRNDGYEQQVFNLINNARTSQGLNSLSMQPQLSNAAFVHSSDMACNDFVDHSGSDASSWYDRVSAQGYANYNSARENIYVGDPEFGGTPEGAFTWWMNSQVHRDNILNPDVSEIGIGYSYNPNSSYGGYYTVVFARP